MEIRIQGARKKQDVAHIVMALIVANGVIAAVAAPVGPVHKGLLA